MLESNFYDDEQPMKKRAKRKRSKKMEEEIAESGETEQRGVVYLCHIPHGFYEPQMRHFFQQFGKVTRLKLWRSKKSGKSRGYAYVEFEYADVAKIVADTMNNYLMFQKLLKCKFIPEDKLTRGVFSQCNRPFKEPYHRESSAKRHNSLLTADEPHIIRNQKRLVKMEGRRKKKLEALGIDYNPTGYKDEWETVKKALAVVTEKRQVEALRLKEIKMRKQAALKLAKQKQKLLSKKRRIGKKQRRREEKVKASAAETPQESPKESPDESISKSPKRKSKDDVTALSGDDDKQPLRKKGRTSSLMTPAKNITSPVSKEEEKEASPTVRKSRRSSRKSLKSEDNTLCSTDGEQNSETPSSKTPSSKTPKSKTPKSKTPKSKTPKSKTPKSKTPKNTQKASQSLQSTLEKMTKKYLSPDPKMVMKTPRSARKGKTPKQELSLDSDNEDSDGGNPKIMEFKGIKVSATPKDVSKVVTRQTDSTSSDATAPSKTPRWSLRAKTPKTAGKGSTKKAPQMEELRGGETPRSNKKDASARKSGKKVKKISISEKELLLF